MNRVVVDASVVVKWNFDEEHAAAARRLLDPRIELAAPEFLVLEIGNAFWAKSHRGLITPSEARGLLTTFMAQPIEIYPLAPLIPAAMEIALRVRRTVYDSSYLALALQLDCPLVTADRKFYDAVIATPLATHIRWIADEI